MECTTHNACGNVRFYLLAVLAANLIYSQGGLSQQTLDNIASLAWQLSSSPALGKALQAMHKAALACRRACMIPDQ